MTRAANVRAKSANCGPPRRAAILIGQSDRFLGGSFLRCRNIQAGGGRLSRVCRALYGPQMSVDDAHAAAIVRSGKIR